MYVRSLIILAGLALFTGCTVSEVTAPEKPAPPNHKYAVSGQVLIKLPAMDADGAQSGYFWASQYDGSIGFRTVANGGNSAQLNNGRYWYQFARPGRVFMEWNGVSTEVVEISDEYPSHEFESIVYEPSGNVTVYPNPGNGPRTIRVSNLGPGRVHVTITQVRRDEPCDRGGYFISLPCGFWDFQSADLTGDVDEFTWDQATYREDPVEPGLYTITVRNANTNRSAVGYALVERPVN